MKKFDTPLDEMLYILSKESEQPVPEVQSDSDKRWLVNTLMVIRTPGELDERFLVLQDELLSKENALNAIDCSEFKFKKHFSVTRQSIIKLKVDAIVCETMNYLGNMTPNLKCTDNKILLGGGLKIREECGRINQENNYICKQGSAFKIAGYNLPCPWVVKMVFPIISDLEIYEIDKIKSAMVSALNILKENDIKRFAINVSVDKMFNIPQDMYINIVIHTISKYIKENKYKANCVLVVDNEADERSVKGRLNIK